MSKKQQTMGGCPMIKLTKDDVNPVDKPIKFFSAIITLLIIIALIKHIFLGFPGKWSSSAVFIIYSAFCLWITSKIAISGYPPSFLL